MAAMAPALTDAPAEARHIRLKLAASSDLSTGAAESNGGTASILLPSSASAGAVKLRPPKTSTSRPLSLGKLQPLMASYLCSDVAPVAKESLKVKGIIVKQPATKGCGPLNGSLLRVAGGGAGGRDLLFRTTLSGGQLKGLVNGTGSGSGSSAMVPVNGLARKAAVPSTALPEKGSIATVNGHSSKPPDSSEALLPLSSKSGDASSPRGEARHLRESVDHNRVPEEAGLSERGQDCDPEVKLEMEQAPSSGKMQDCNPPGEPKSSSLSWSTPSSPTPRCPSPSSLETLLRERAQRTQRRQAELSGNLRRLCKRLRVVQAKQVERHVRQQLSGFLDQALAHSSAPGRGSSEADTPSCFLKEGSVPAELERLHLSGVASLRAAEAQFDSDATESSSGGESDAEEEELARVDTEQRHVSLWRRAEGRFALERASIISRWTWLQAHISDLEYRIRQQADIYRHVRSSKGSVELGDPAPSGQTMAQKAEASTSPISQNATEAISQSGRFPSDGAINNFTQSSALEVTNAKAAVSPDGGCSAARTRPLVTCRRRRLIQPCTVQNLDAKVQHGYCSLARQCEVNTSCMMCGSNRVLPKAELLYERPLVEKACLQDPSIHPTLSLLTDMSLSVHLQRALKAHGQTRPTEKLKPRKKLLLKHKFPFLPPSSSSSSSTLSKHKLRLTSSHMAAVRLAHHKGAPGSGGPYRMERPLIRSLGRKRTREASLDELDAPKLPAEVGNPCGSHPSIQPSTPGTQSRLLSLPGDSVTPPASAGQASPCFMARDAPVRKKRNENSFDINNIVIPMSVAATTRVEKLQYKEIITPSWREVDAFARALAQDDENVEVEDLSDSAFALLHQRCEEQERLRWRWTALAPAKRRGSRSYKSVDGRTTPSLGGTNPPSPDVGPPPTLQDYGPIASPLTPPSPDTPSSRDAHTPSSRDSHVPRPASADDTCCSTPDLTYEEKTVQPWERRSFPLSEDPTLESSVEPSPRHWFPSSSHFSAGSESDASSP